MSVAQYNAYCQGYRLKQTDDLALQIQAAYYCAYWNGFSKHKKSLKSVLKALYAHEGKRKKKKLEKIDIAQYEKEFNKLEDYKNGRKKQ